MSVGQWVPVTQLLSCAAEGSALEGVEMLLGPRKVCGLAALLGGSILDLPQTCWTLVGGVGCVALARWLLRQVPCCDGASCVRSPSLLGYVLS